MDERSKKRIYFQDQSVNDDRVRTFEDCARVELNISRIDKNHEDGGPLIIYYLS